MLGGRYTQRQWSCFIWSIQLTVTLVSILLVIYSVDDWFVCFMFHVLHFKQLIKNVKNFFFINITKLKQLQNVTSTLIIIHFHENNSKSCKKVKNIWADNFCEGQTTFLSSWTDGPGCFWHESPTVILYSSEFRVRNLKFATYLKFATCVNSNKINELRWDLLNVL